MSGGQIVGWGALVLGAGGAGGIITAKITARSTERVAGKSKPHELTEADAKVAEAETHAFAAFMAEARLELDRLKAEAVESRVERDELRRTADELRRTAAVLAEQLRACEEKHATSAAEIHALQRQLDELRTQTGNDPQETT